jgi:hypothetical protein
LQIRVALDTLTGAGKGGPKGGKGTGFTGNCHYCRIEGHRINECNKRTADLKAKGKGREAPGYVAGGKGWYKGKEQRRKGQRIPVRVKAVQLAAQRKLQRTIKGHAKHGILRPAGLGRIIGSRRVRAARRNAPRCIRPVDLKGRGRAAPQHPTAPLRVVEFGEKGWKEADLGGSRGRTTDRTEPCPRASDREGQSRV